MVAHENRDSDPAFRRIYRRILTEGFMLTQTTLKELFHYCPATGLITRIASINNHKAQAGDVAGWITTNGYLCLRIEYKAHSCHRLAWLYMTGEWPSEDIDHINRIRTDNRWSNLREASRSENLRNMSMSRKNTSGFTGVHWDKVNLKWRAVLRVEGRTICLGRHKSKSDAIHARKAANVKYGFSVGHGCKKNA